MRGLLHLATQGYFKTEIGYFHKMMDRKMAGRKMKRSMDIEKLRYPIGKFAMPDTADSSLISKWIAEIESFPSKVKNATAALGDAQLNWVYRPQGWSIKQLIHHCADSHMNSFIRFKLSLTEENPTIKAYHEALWAELPDSKLPVSHSLQILEGLHYRWAVLLKSLSADDLKQTFIHPESGKQFTIRENIGIYAWHCNHHFAHILQALKFKGQFNG